MRTLLLACALLAAAPFAARAQSPQDDLVRRGEYLARAADCTACHSQPGKPLFSGGRPFVLPFGTIYSTNITPDKATGVGDYTDDEWVGAIQRGVGRGGKHLYPAMPYSSYTRMTREDALAIKAYIFAQPAVRSDNPPNDLGFPYNQRWLMVFWNLFNAPDGRFQPDGGKSADWNRGAYLVQALGHCEQCHTPRNFMYGLSGRTFAGAEQQGWVAYNLSSDKEHGIGGWSDDELRSYLSTGQAPGRGPASGPMAEAVEHSLRYLTPDDINAMVVYLRSVAPQPDGPPATPRQFTPVAADPLGRRVFAEACAGCHLPDGRGRQSPWAALGGAHSVGDPAGLNLTQVLANGTDMHTNRGYVFMHPFTASYTNEELAAVSNYLIATMSGRQGQVTPAQLGKLRGNPGRPGS